MASSEKRCLYEVLGLSRDCSADEIRSAYRRLALQRHPDKLVRSGVPEADATAAFQELVNAYEVLSDARERAWYDSHRNQILFSSSTAAATTGGSSAFVPDLFSFFSNSVYSGYSDSGRGFYKVYGDLFEKIYANELNFAKKLGLPLPKEAPVMGNLESPYAQVTAFYSYWLGFTTVLDFFWADQYDAMAGPNRKSRRLMEEENKKLRKKARREYNETVRGLAEFVKKRDKRVIDMQIKRNEEMERRKEEEKQRKKELERQKAEKARNYEEPEWARVEEIEEEEEDEAEDSLEEKKNEFYCVACSKKFRSDKQWKNHEQSKKHKEKVVELREAFREEDIEYEEAEGDKMEESDGIDIDYLSADDGVSKLQDEFEGRLGIPEDDSDDGQNPSSEAVESEDPNDISGMNGVSEGIRQNNNNDDDDEDDEASILEAMLSGRRNRNKARNQPKAPATKSLMESDGDELEFMEYNDTKGSRRNRGGRRRRGRRQEEAEPVRTSTAERNDEAEEHEVSHDDAAEPISKPLPKPETNMTADDVTEKDHKHAEQAVNKKVTAKKENASKLKSASKGRKHKVATKGPDNTCEKCGEQFQSKTKLHKHLGETGHASLRHQ
ncbi:DNAJ protein JJJ1 homolog isoform X2 [Salvia miltiorrhiza]|uniref:DNAJ protein JJJ1 homolog isoform X2 n=1 Tax=Salvia miltiorrhiza TaxID=226208 RepID=UPI0025AD7D2D|nr:DNAJ protein JJJ1 homolog isoform X2 [Salvia miltiorrhiza]